MPSSDSDSATSNRSGWLDAGRWVLPSKKLKFRSLSASAGWDALRRPVATSASPVRGRGRGCLLYLDPDRISWRCMRVGVAAGGARPRPCPRPPFAWLRTQCEIARHDANRGGGFYGGGGRAKPGAAADAGAGAAVGSASARSWARGSSWSRDRGGVAGPALPWLLPLAGLAAAANALSSAERRRRIHRRAELRVRPPRAAPVGASPRMVFRPARRRAAAPSARIAAYWSGWRRAFPKGGGARGLLLFTAWNALGVRSRAVNWPSSAATTAALVAFAAAGALRFDAANLRPFAPAGRRRLRARRSSSSPTPATRASPRSARRCASRAGRSPGRSDHLSSVSVLYFSVALAAVGAGGTGAMAARGRAAAEVAREMGMPRWRPPFGRRRLRHAGACSSRSSWASRMVVRHGRGGTSPAGSRGSTRERRAAAGGGAGRRGGGLPATAFGTCGGRAGGELRILLYSPSPPRRAADAARESCTLTPSPPPAWRLPAARRVASPGGRRGRRGGARRGVRRAAAARALARARRRRLDSTGRANRRPGPSYRNPDRPFRVPSPKHPATARGVALSDRQVDGETPSTSPSDTSSPPWLALHRC